MQDELLNILGKHAVDLVHTECWGEGAERHREDVSFVIEPDLNDISSLLRIPYHRLGVPWARRWSLLELLFLNPVKLVLC